MIPLRKMVPPVIGLLVGAIIVGGVWYGTAASSNHNAVVAKVGDKPITRAALLSETESYAGSQMLSQLITNVLVLDAAQKQNVTASAAEVNQSLQNFEQQNGMSSDAQLQSALAQNHMTKQQLMDQLKVSVLEQKLAENKVKVTDQQIQDYYNKNKKSLATPEKVSLSHIVVASQAEAQQVKTQLGQGKSFTDLAKQKSMDTTTKDKGGALGSFSEAQLNQADPTLAKAAFQLKKGEVSAPIKTSSGYELLTVTDIQPASTPTLAQANSQITTTLKQQGMESPQQLVAELAKSNPIQIVDNSYSSVKTQLENPAPAQAGSVGQ